MSCGKNMEALPATFPAIDAVDPSVEIFHWYWGVDRHLEENFAARGMNYCFANFNAPAFKDWSGRISAPHARGVCISNWGQTSLRTLQRNGVLYDLAYSSFLLWNPCFGSEDYPDIDRLTFRRLYRLGEPENRMTCRCSRSAIRFRPTCAFNISSTVFFWMKNNIIWAITSSGRGTARNTVSGHIRIEYLQYRHGPGKKRRPGFHQRRL